jgi:hypothetical protein
MSGCSYPGNAGHALIAAADLQWAMSTDLLPPLPHSQEQRRRPPTQHVRQADRAAPCRATWQGQPAPYACCSAAGGVSAGACPGRARAADTSMQNVNRNT